MARRERKISTDRYDQQFNERDRVARVGALDYSKMGIEQWKHEMGNLKFNIIPFEIKSANHPQVAKKRMKVGELDYVMDVEIHRFLGPNKEDVLCPKKNYGKPCPACEESSKAYDAGNKEDGKSLKTSRRCFYNIQPMGLRGPLPLCWFEVSHYLFTKELMEEANACGEGAGVVPFADPEDGSIIKCRAAEEAFGANKMTEYKSWQFLPREEEISDELIDSAVSFDELLILKSYEEIEAIMYGEELPADSTPPEQESTRTTTKSQEVNSQRTRGREDAPKTEETPECPEGLKFGVDCDTDTKCNRCPDAIYTKCVKVAGV